MSLRTYSLITHPAFISFVESQSHVDGGLHSLPARLVPEHLPHLRSIYDIATYLDVTPSIIRSIMTRPQRHYRQFEFEKRSGGVRTIDAPRTFLKVIQWWILDTILQSVTVSPNSHGFVKGKSYVTNAREHIGATHVLNVDLEDFFPSISRPSIVRIFRTLRYEPSVSTDLSYMTTLNGKLPQGAPTSPALANILMIQADIELESLASSVGAKITRYADDITFSSQNRIDNSVLLEIKRIVSRHGFRLNNVKTKYMGKNDRKEVTGLVLGLNDVRLPREYLNRCRGWFHRVITEPEENVLQRNKVEGTVALIEMVRGAGSAKVAGLGRLALAKIDSVGTDLPPVTL